MTAVRRARPADIDEITAILDEAMLAFDRDTVPAKVREGDAFVAVDGERTVGALLLDDDRIEAIAVRRYARDRGHGRELVETATAARGRLEATCDETERDFFESLGFSMAERADGRWEGVRQAD